ncbi:MAG TPA: ACT domain-containing protein, partial [Gemmatimonadales bacterium]|nr:ACT domain-containing protein [Gemmatimonadales bacterium]
ILARELKRRRLEAAPPEAHAGAAKALGYADGKGLLVGLGRGDVGVGKVVRGLFPDLPDDELAEPKPTVFGKVIDRIRLGRGIKIQGVDGLMVRYAQCCQPLPGEPVVGYVTQGRGISIHRTDCPNLLTLPAHERRVEIDWQEAEGESFAVRLAVSGEDRRGLYADLMQVISASGTNIRSAEIHSKDGTMFGSVTLEVDNLPHLTRVLKAMRRVKGVAEVERREAGN